MIELSDAKAQIEMLKEEQKTSHQTLQTHLNIAR